MKIKEVPLITTDQQIEELQIAIGDLVSKDIERTVKGEKKYRSSWRKRGGWEAAANITRKIDRIEAALEESGWDIFQAILDHPASDGSIDGKDSLLDDLRDLRVYLLLTEDFILRLSLNKKDEEI